MENPSFFLSIIAEASGLVLLILLGFVFLLKRDKSNLLGYISHLKDKIKTLTQKIKELDSDDNNDAHDLLTDTIDHIKTIYVNKFGHEIGSKNNNINEADFKQHFLYVFGYQGLKATLTSLENSNTAEHTWEKISAQMIVLIENFRIMSETQFETIIDKHVDEKVEQHELENSNKKPPALSNAIETATKKDPISKSAHNENASSDQFILDRKNEIDRLKGQVSSQFEEIWNLQNNLKDKLSSSTPQDVNAINEDMETIARQLKDAQLCITMMEADIATSDEEIADLKERLDKTTAKASIIPPSSNELTESIKKKDAIIARFSQESKEMLSLIDGMENNAEEQSKRIQELELKLNIET